MSWKATDFKNMTVWSLELDELTQHVCTHICTYILYLHLYVSWPYLFMHFVSVSSVLIFVSLCWLTVPPRSWVAVWRPGLLYFYMYLHSYLSPLFTVLVFCISVCCPSVFLIVFLPHPDRGQLFEDQDFPPSNKAIYSHKKPGLHPILWMRPHVSYPCPVIGRQCRW